MDRCASTASSAERGELDYVDVFKGNCRFKLGQAVADNNTHLEIAKLLRGNTILCVHHNRRNLNHDFVNEVARGYVWLPAVGHEQARLVTLRLLLIKN